MRTSGAATESRLTGAIIVVVLLLLVALAGGPMEFLRTIEQVLRAAGGSVAAAVKAFTG